METPEKQKRVLEAWKNDDLEEFRENLKVAGVKVDYTYLEEGYRTILEVICDTPRPSSGDFVKVAIECGAPVNFRNFVIGRTAMLGAVQAFNYSAVEALIEAGADINTLDDNGDNCLHLLARVVPAKDEERQLRCLDILLKEKDILLNELNRKGLTPILLACHRGVWKVVVKLLCQGSRLDIDNKPEDGVHSLTAREEIKKNRPDMVDLLPPERGPDNWKVQMDGSNLFSLLCQGYENRFCTALVKEVEQNGQKNLLLYFQNDTFLQYAASHRQHKAASTLLSLGADVNFDKPMGITPIQLACKVGDANMVALLLDHNAKLDSNDAGQNILHILAQNDHFSEGHEQCLRKILALNIDVNLRDKFGKTPLHYAAEFPHSKAVEILLEKGAYLFAEDVNGQPAFLNIPVDVIEKFLDSKITWNHQRGRQCLLTICLDFLSPPTTMKSPKEPLLSDQIQLNEEECETSGLMRLSTTKHLQHLLAHPVFSAFITKKWTLVRPIYYFQISFFALFYTLFMSYALLMTTEYAKFNRVQVVSLKVVIIIFLILRYLNDLTLASVMCCRSFKYPQLPIDFILTILVTIVISKDAEPGSEVDGCWYYLYPHFTSIALLLSAVQFSLLLAEHPKLSLTYIVAYKIAYGCVKVFLAFFAFIISFKVVFIVMTAYFCRDDHCRVFSLFFIPFYIPLDHTHGIGVEQNSMFVFTLFSLVVTVLVLQTFAIAIVDSKKVYANSQLSSLLQQLRFSSLMEELFVINPRKQLRQFSKFFKKELKLPVIFNKLSKRILFFSQSNIRLDLFPNDEQTLTTMRRIEKPQCWWDPEARMRKKNVRNLERMLLVKTKAETNNSEEEVWKKKVDTLLENYKKIFARMENVEETGKQIEKLLIQSLAISNMHNEL